MRVEIIEPEAFPGNCTGLRRDHVDWGSAHLPWIQGLMSVLAVLISADAFPCYIAIVFRHSVLYCTVHGRGEAVKLLVLKWLSVRLLGVFPWTRVRQGRVKGVSVFPALPVLLFKLCLLGLCFEELAVLFAHVSFENFACRRFGEFIYKHDFLGDFKG